MNSFSLTVAELFHQMEVPETIHTHDMHDSAKLNFRLEDYLSTTTVEVTSEMRLALDRPWAHYGAKELELIQQLTKHLSSFRVRWHSYV